MQGLSPKKKFLIIKLYLSGLSYSEIETKACVSKGSVANVISDLKAGLFPEAEATPEQLESLRELATDLHHLKLTPAQAGAGLAALAHFNELGIEPRNIQKWAAMCKQLASEHTDTHTFVKAALYLEEIRNLTGLTPESLEEKVHSLQQKVASLEASAEELKGYPAQLEQLKEKAKALILETDQLEKQRNALSKDVAQKEKREEKLSQRIEDLEGKALAAEGRLSTTNKSLKTLAELGFSPDDFAGFVQRLAGVANRHSIKPMALRNRLFHELEQLDAGMSLELLVNTGRQEVSEMEKSIAKKVVERTALEDTLKVLHEQKETIKSAMVEEQTNICEVFQATTATAKEAVTEFTSKLQQGICESLQDVQKLREHALEVGQEEGRLQGAIETNESLRTLLALTKGDGKVQAIDVRAIATSVLRGTKTWMQRNPDMISALHQLTAKIDAIIGELERWKI